MYLVYLACAYLAACYLFGVYVFIRLITGRRLRIWIMQLIRKPVATSRRSPKDPVLLVGQEAGHRQVA